MIMKIEHMRMIDFWVGMPICFLLTWAVRCYRHLFGQDNAPPRNILFIQLSEMGSVVLADPALRKARRELQAELFFAIFVQNAETLQIQKTVPVENVFTICNDSFARLAWDVIRFIGWVRSRNIDTVIDMELFSRFSAILSGFSGAARIAGFDAFYNEGLYRGGMLTHRVAYNPHMHIAKNFIALVNAVISPRIDIPCSKTVIPDHEIIHEKFTANTAQKEAMAQKIKRFYPQFNLHTHQLVLINPYGGSLLPQREWMPENYITVIRLILDEHPEVLILITGDEAAVEKVQAMKNNIQQARCVNFANQTRLADLPVLYCMATLMLSSDSGPVHFAAVTDMPTYVLYGPETPALYGSLGNFVPITASLACSPCVSAWNHRKTPCRDNQCMKVIRPDQVYEILKPALSSYPGRASKKRI